MSIRDAMGVRPELRRQLSGPEGFFLRTIKGTVGFGDDGTAVVLGQLPKGAVVKEVEVLVTTAFDSSGTDLVDVGTAADPDGFAVDIDVSSTGLKADSDGALIGEIVTADTVEATYAQSVADATAGEAIVLVHYYEA